MMKIGKTVGILPLVMLAVMSGCSNDPQQTEPVEKISSTSSASSSSTPSLDQPTAAPSSAFATPSPIMTPSTSAPVHTTAPTPTNKAIPKRSHTQDAIPSSVMSSAINKPHVDVKKESINTKNRPTAKKPSDSRTVTTSTTPPKGSTGTRRVIFKDRIPASTSSHTATITKNVVKPTTRTTSKPVVVKKTATKKTSTVQRTQRKEPRQVSSSSRTSMFFIFATGSVDGNEKLLRTIGTDAITFGYRVLPAKKSSFPKAVQSVVGASPVYTYTGGGHWSPQSLESGDRQIVVNGTTWTVFNINGRKVVSSDSSDKNGNLVTAGNNLGRKVFLGLPQPKPNGAHPDMSYASVVDGVTKRFVKDAVMDGADGFYQSFEMPLSGTSYWDRTINLYARQNAIVARHGGGRTVIVSPYLEARTYKAYHTPSKSVAGARRILGTANGVNLILSPQDGLGTGTTALKADHSRSHIASTESYFSALHKAVGNKLWVTTEMMRPNGTGRLPSSNARVKQQLAATAPYTQRSIGFIWEDNNRGIGATYLRGGLSGITTNS